MAADTALEFPVGDAVAWTIRAGVRNEYDALPQELVDKLDTTYYLNLGYNWSAHCAIEGLCSWKQIRSK